MKRLLYVSPVVPSVGGNGLAMRAGMVLRVLAARYTVSLLVIPLYWSPAGDLPAEIAALCHGVTVLPAVPDGQAALPDEPAVREGLAQRLTRMATGWLRGGQPARPGASAWFDVVHVFRLATLPYAPISTSRAAWAPGLHLDLDDIESTSHRRLAALYRLHGDEAQAQREDVEAERYESLESRVLEQCTRVYVCSEQDRAALANRGRAEVCVLPNALPMRPALPLAPADEDRPFTLLFVGTLGYYPNEEGLAYLGAEVLPLLRRAAPRAFRLDIVGVGMSAGVQALRTLPEVRLIGRVPDVAPWYAQADAVVVPIRAGGGTRIKLLEAFAYRRPVVSTSIGAEGIAVRDEQHLLLADEPEAFARQCARLMADPELGRRLTARAFELFSQRYTIEAAARAHATCDGAPPRRGWR